MKKIIYIIPVICSLLFVGQAKAETYEYYYNIKPYTISEDFSSFMNDLQEYKNVYTQLYDLMFEKYNSEYKEDYPYYIISISHYGSPYNFLHLNLSIYKDPVYFKLTSDSVYAKMYSSVDDTYLDDFSLYKTLYSEYYIEEHNYILPHEVEHEAFNNAHYLIKSGSYVESSAIESNFDIPIFFENENDKLIINDFRNTGSQYILNHGDNIPILYKSNGLVDSFTDYTEVNLNDYAYVAISLKDYNQEPFEVYFKVKGQFCATPVYNYGMTSKDSVTNNKVTDRCSLYYDDFTSHRFFVLDPDLKNHSIYYLKSYDTTKENIVKIDTSVFDISYITEEEKDNPYVTVNGKKYPTIPYDDLPSTSTKNEEENFIPGETSEISFTDIFTKPLDFLKDVWDSISSVFDLVAELVSLLPEPIKTFLIISFTLAIVLGLIKIIL